MSAVVFVLFVASIWTQNILANDKQQRKSPVKWIEPMRDFLTYNEGPTEVRHSHQWNEEHEVCWTDGCFHTAVKLLGNMNLSADPCDDFYEYVCGNFIDKTTLLPHENDKSPYTIVISQINTRLKAVLEDSPHANEPRPLRMAKDFYETCMDEDKIEEVGLGYIKKILKRMGGWPVLEGSNWDSSMFTWEDTIYKLFDEGFEADYLIAVGFIPDFENNTRRIILLDQPDFISTSLNDKRIYNLMKDIVVIFGADNWSTVTELEDIREFEMQLFKITSPAEERQNVDTIYNPMTVFEMQEKFPSIPWFEYFSKVFLQTVQVKPDDVVNVRDISYVNKLENLLAITPKRTQANYILWRAVYYTVPYLMKNIRLMLSKNELRWEFCVGETLESLHFASSSLYVKYWFNKETKQKAKEMVDDISEELYHMLENLDWLDNETRQIALDKAKAMKPTFIAYPEEILDVKKLETYYKKLMITQGNFLKNKLNTVKINRNNIIRQLRKPVEKSDWMIFPKQILAVGAYYDPTINVFVVPAGILQDIFFLGDRPGYLNYGALGSVIGHELIHGFDNKGSKYDKDGLKDWWNPSTKKNFNERINCIINQYGNYSMSGGKVNGIRTQGENIADNGGIKLAYLAYNRWVDNHGAEERLLALEDFSPRQMFWISAASMWCSKPSPLQTSFELNFDDHSPKKFRVLGPLSNRPEFAEDFNCPIGSKMNPRNKCQVW